MCIAIANLKGKPLTEQEIKNCWSNNKDGGGILYKENGVLKIYKNLKSVSTFYKKYTKVIAKSNCLLHFRIQTAGGVNVKNCHPFFVNKNLGFIHNGVISGYGNKVAGQSDTYSYNQMMLKALPEGFQNNDAICQLIGSDIGTGSKFAFMDIDEEFTIIGDNRKGAHYDKESGNWFSNDSYKRDNDYVWAGNKKVYKSNYYNTTKTTPMKKSTKTEGPKIKRAWHPTLGRYIEVKVYSWVDIPDHLKNGYTKYSVEFGGYVLKSVDEYGLKEASEAEYQASLMVNGKTEKKKKEPIQFKREEIEELDDNQNFDDDYYDDSYYRWWEEQECVLEDDEEEEDDAAKFIAEIAGVFDLVPTSVFEGDNCVHNVMKHPVTVVLPGAYAPRCLSVEDACTEIRNHYGIEGSWAEMWDLMKLHGDLV